MPFCTRAGNNRSFFNKSLRFVPVVIPPALFCVSTEYLYLVIIFDGRGWGFLAYFKNKELNPQLSGGWKVAD